MSLRRVSWNEIVTMERSRLMISFKFLFSLVLCQFAVVFGQLISGSDIESWYAGLHQPVFAVPFDLFIPLRSLVLFLLGVSLFLVMIRIDKFRRVKSAFIFFMIQIALNVLLNIAFFGFRSLFASAIIAVPAAIFAIILTIKAFRVSEAAGLFTLPYLLGIIYTVFFDSLLYIMNR